MISKLNVYQSSTEAERPPISDKARDYLIEFIITEVLEKKSILLNANIQPSPAVNVTCHRLQNRLP
jgi:hypothetical protein